VRMISLAVTILALVLWVNACTPQKTDSPFVPPVSGTAAATVGAAVYTPPPQPTAIGDTPSPPILPGFSGDLTTCSNSLRFIEDITIPDGTVVRSGEKIEKIWRVENNGTCSWDSRYRLRLASGDQLGAPVELALYPARPGTQAELRIIFIAPPENRIYRSTWQAYGPDGIAFGDPFYIDILVQSPGGHSTIYKIL
jgi:hypothetical protein